MTTILPGAARRRAARLLFAGSAALAALAPTGPAAAQVAPAPAAASGRTITLDDALRIALERNSTLRLAQNQAELSDVTVRQARAQFVPDLRLNAQTAEAVGRNFSQEEGRILNTATQSVNTGLSSSVVLFNGFANTRTLEQARLNQTASQQDVGRARETVVFTVMSNFLGLIEQREQLRVQQESLASQEALERQIQTFVNAGARPISDLYQQQASVASARLALVQTQRAVALAEMGLVQTLHLDPLASYDFQAPALGEAPTGSRQFDAAALIQRALEQRADVDAAAARVSAAEQGVRVAGASRWPTISLSGGYNSSYNSAASAGLFNQFDQRRGGSLSLGISLPVFDRFSSSVNTQRARVQAENSRINLENVRQQVAVEVRRAVLDYQSAEEQLRQAQAQLRAAELALTTSQQRYQVGAATLVELSQARATQVRAAGDLVNARYNLVFQSRLMDYYVGTLAVPDLPAP